MKKITFYLTFLLLMTINHYSSAANVSSVSQESFAQYGKEDAYWVVTVTCNNDGEHIVQRKTDSDTWCPKGSNDLCSENKKVAFENACGDVHTAKIEEAKAAEQQQRDQKRAQKRAQELVLEKEAQEKEIAEQKIREQEQKIQQQIYMEESILSLEKEILALNVREREIQQRLAQIDELINSDEED